MMHDFAKLVPIDAAMFHETQAISGARFGQLLGYFLEDATQTLQQLAHQLPRQHWDEACALAHTLKSSALQFGFVTIGTPARALEVCCMACHRGNAAPVGVENILQQLQDALHYLHPHLQHFIEKLEP